MNLRRIRARLLRREEGGRYVHLAFALEDATWQIQPGQFVQVQVRASGQYDPFLYRPFSAFWTEPGKLGLLVLPRGRGTRWLVSRKPGTELVLLGPLGQPWPRATRVGLVGGGSGVAPVVHYLREYPEEVAWVRLGFREDIPAFLSDLLPPSVQVEFWSEHGTPGARKGRVTDAPLPLENTERVLACGPPGMLEALRAHVPADRYYASFEEIMGCGFGLCMGCLTPRTGGGHFRTCREGPLFRADQVDWARLSAMDH
ncbi:MAG: hypothetical protein L3J76_05340 [Candidatus Hydrothermae bacterium]|nr:hypothetical protein [Candidatus Hydrothermae bacterium]